MWVHPLETDLDLFMQFLEPAECVVEELALGDLSGFMLELVCLIDMMTLDKEVWVPPNDFQKIPFSVFKLSSLLLVPWKLNPNRLDMKSVGLMQFLIHPAVL